MATKNIQLSKEEWTRITNPGSNSTCWKKSGVQVVVDHTDIYASETIPLSSEELKQERAKRVPPDRDSNEVLTLRAENENDVFYALSLLDNTANIVSDTDTLSMLPDVLISFQSTELIETFFAIFGGSYSRLYDMYTWDFEGILKICSPNVLPFFNGRAVTNILSESENLKDSAWTEYNTGSELILTPNQPDPQGGMTAYRLQATATGSQRATIRQVIDSVAGDYVNTAWMKNNGGDSNKVVLSYYNYDPVTVSDEWERYATQDYNLSDGSKTFRIGIRGATNPGSIDVLIWRPQCENVSGQANKNPGEYVATGAEAVTKWFRKYNANSILNNVVTEKTGESLPVKIGASSAPADTNLFPANASRGFDNWDIKTGTAVQDQVGVDAQPNKAWTLTDSSLIDFEYFTKYFTIDNDSEYYSYSIKIKKDASQGRYIGVRLRLFNGTAVDQYVVFDIEQGRFTNEVVNNGEYLVHTEDNWDFYFINLTCLNNGTGNTTAECWLLPAISKDGIILDVSTTGSIVADWCQFMKAYRCPIHLVPGAASLSSQELILADEENGRNLITETISEVEEVENYNFDTDTVWTKFGSVTISGGSANVNEILVNIVKQTLSYAQIPLFRYSYKIKDYVSGSHRLSVGGRVTPWETGNGVFTGYILSTTTSVGVIVQHTGYGVANYSIDFLSLNLVTQEKGAVFAEARLLPDDFTNKAYAIIVSSLGTGNGELYFSNSGNQLRSYDGANLSFLADAANGVSKYLSYWDGTSKQITANGISSAAGLFSGSWGGGKIEALGAGGAYIWNGVTYSIGFFINKEVTQTQAEEITS